MTDRELLAYVMGKLRGLVVGDYQYTHQWKEPLEDLECYISEHLKKIGENRNKPVDKD